MKIVIVMPAYNASKTLRKTYFDIPKRFRKNVLLVDDGSIDDTTKLARKLGLKTFTHPQNRGYGANQKTCYTIALSEGADIVVMVHPDYQYDSSLVPELIKPIVERRADIMLGSRIRSRQEALGGGMPLYKYIGNRFLTFVENLVLGQNLSEYHTGFRAFNKKTLTTIPFHKFSDNFVFDQEILILALKKGFKAGEIHVPVRYFPEASSISFLKSVRYGLETVMVLIKYLV
jgi:glycosyltransferase involved in cell wall biosynthesis